MTISPLSPATPKKYVAHLAAVLALTATLALCLAGCSPASVQGPSIDSLDANDLPALPSDKNPIDFAALQEENSDVCAWIYIPGTEVNLPVLQNRIADNYYLVHDVHGNESELGAIYSQSINSTDFTDPVTVLYGHTFEVNQSWRDKMFGTLHNFEDAEFFDSHPNFYIYTPTQILTYEIASAYEYDNRHIMNSFDFSDPAVVQEYYDYVVNPDSMVKNVREGEQLVAGEDSIIQLSTCTRPANDAARYLVTGVLVNEQSTE
ncbi:MULTISPECIES: class B sortase [unclassified Adlercreutzia]|uniref:class B sortase n=1 Tax=unclassified Adlercreutzia TaxID=2636013 RepID=UPI0013EA66DD|nr:MULTISPECIES: class B sortase [unclassified Adlercreutzia]